MTMDHDLVQHFSMGTWTLWLAWLTSFVGSLMGLSCVARARRERRRSARVRWTVAGAFAIGGVAIWLMHFIAMLGFAVTGSPVRYSVWLTALSVLVVGIGLFIVIQDRYTLRRLVCAGAVAGVGVAFMHYLGMASIRFQGDITYDPTLVALSVLIAVVAATVAFWFTVMRAPVARPVAGVVMAVAVTGMHYTGMAAVGVTVMPSMPAPQDTEAFDLVFPVFLISALLIASLLWALLTSVGPAAASADQAQAGASSTRN
jgi:NO-binding membrane sensor protein with MHYT domain